MVDFLSNWAEEIIVVVVISSIIELIVPNGNSKKYIKVVIGMYILFIIIFPIINKVNKGTIDVAKILNIDLYEEKLEKENVKTQKLLENNNSRSIKDIYISNLKENIKSKLKGKGYEIYNIDIEIKDNDKYEIENIILDLRKINNKENKLKEEKTLKQDKYMKNKEKNKIINEIVIDKIKINENDNKNNDEKDIYKNVSQEQNNNLDNINESKELNLINEKDKKEIKEYLSQEFAIKEENIKIR